MKHRITAALERFSRAMLAPLRLSFGGGPAAGGGRTAYQCAAGRGAALFAVGAVQLAGGIIYKCLTAVISNLSVLFCTGLAAALAKRESIRAAFIA